MHRIRTSIEVMTPASRVWAVLMDFPAHADWNPFIRRIAGRTEPGSKLQVTIQPEGGRPMSFTPEVVACEPEREFRWSGKFLVRGAFDGVHAFVLSQLSPSACRFTHEETFSGILVPLLMRGRMRSGTAAGFHAMNRALKSRAEGGDA
jgi:hypothetical protein